MGKPMIGYLTKRKLGVEGEWGLAYDCILAENGLFLEAQNPLIKARILIGETLVRGLEPLPERVELSTDWCRLTCWPWPCDRCGRTSTGSFTWR